VRNREISAPHGVGRLSKPLPRARRARGTSLAPENREEAALKSTTVSQVMTRGVLTVDADWSVTEAATFLEDHAISGAPVVDEGGALLGVVSTTDIVRRGAVTESPADEPHAFYRQGIERAVGREEAARFQVVDGSIKVREIMTPMIFSVEASASVQEAADTMIRGRIHRLFAMDSGKLVGVVSSLDLLTLIRNV
jgi:CBS domain-containing protein